MEDIKEKICNTGGAHGADTIFENECIKHNIKVISWSFKEHNIKSLNRRILSKEELDEGFENVKKANETLKRNIYGMNIYIRNLLSRNWFQVKYSNAIYAISAIQNNMKIVHGGTGWACQQAIDNNKEIYVFDQFKNNWYKYNYTNEIFEVYKDKPILLDAFAGIGTREINENGIKAIKELF